MIRPMAWRLLLPCLFLAGSSPVLAGTQQWTFQVWQGGCLVALEARTNDDGDRNTVQARAEGPNLLVLARGSREQLEGCVTTFAYWNPAILKAERLLNAQTGRLEKVRIEAQGQVHECPGSGQPGQSLSNTRAGAADHALVRRGPSLGGTRIAGGRWSQADLSAELKRWPGPPPPKSHRSPHGLFHPGGCGSRMLPGGKP